MTTTTTSIAEVQQNELTSHLLRVPGTVAEGSGVRGSGARHGSAQRPAGATALMVSDLQMTGIVNGAERWASADGSTVEYRIGHRKLRFHAWKRKTFYGYWSMGGEISTSGLDFERAQVDSHYYMTVSSPCQLVKVDSDGDRNDDYLDEYEWGWNAQQPERVASLCRAQWNQARFSDLVTAGSGCTSFRDDDWPIGFPADWPTDTGVALRPPAVSMRARSIGVVARGSTTLVNLDPSSKPVQVSAGPGPRGFQLPVGAFTLPGNSEHTLRVTFLGGTAPGVYRTSMRVVVGGRTLTVPITATVTQEGQPR